MKRISIVLGLIALFLAALVGIAGCGLGATDNLSNAVGSGDGPGSGNWNPAQPTNGRQYQRLYEIENQLMEKSVELGNQHKQMVLLCYDKDGNRIMDSDNPLCAQPIRELEIELSNHLNDYRAGYAAFTTCDCSHLGALELELPERIGGYPLVLDRGIPTIEMPTLGAEESEGEDKPWWYGSLC